YFLSYCPIPGVRLCRSPTFLIVICTIDPGLVMSMPRLVPPMFRPELYIPDMPGSPEVMFSLAAPVWEEKELKLMRSNEEVVEVAQDLLAKRYGGTQSLSEVEQLSGSGTATVLRARV